MAQIIVSVQMVLEEKFVYKHDVHPLRAVGTEGAAAVSYGYSWGSGVTTLKEQQKNSIVTYQEIIFFISFDH